MRWVGSRLILRLQRELSDDELATLAWLFHMNHGIFMTPGVEEEWTLSIAHSQDDVRRYVSAFETFARDVTGA